MRRLNIPEVNGKVQFHEVLEVQTEIASHSHTHPSYFRSRPPLSTLRTMALVAIEVAYSARSVSFAAAFPVTPCPGTVSISGR